MNRIRKALLLLLCTGLCLGLAGCTGHSTPEAGAGGITVVTTNYFLYDAARHLVRPEDRVVMLISPGAESHDFELTLSDMALLETCDLFAYVGGEGEAWVYSALETFADGGVSLPVFCAMEAVEEAGGLLPGEHSAPEEHHDHQDHGAGESHRYAGWDEHIWLSIPNAIVILEEMHRALAASVPDAALPFPTEYTDRLRELDADFRALTSSVPSPEILIADRFPFAYLTEAYGIGYTAAFSGCTSDTEPSLDTVNTLIEKTAALGLGTVFVTELSDCRTAEAVCARAAGTRIAELHSCHNVTAADFAAGVTYYDLMLRNFEVLEKLWKP